MKILWIGDAGTSTGFSKVCHEIGGRLVTDYGHDIDVLAIGFEGSRPVNTPLRLWAAGKLFGFDRTVELLEKVQPDLVITNEDAPFLLRRLFENPWDREQKLLRGPWKIAAYMPVDGDGFPPLWERLPEWVEVMPYTKFGADQFGLDRWIHHGVDTDVFHPVSEDHPIITGNDVFVSRRQIREYHNIPPDDFVIGRVDTNSGRKDWPSMWRVVEGAGAELDFPVSTLWHTKMREPSNGVDLEALLSRSEGVVTYRVSNANDWTIEDVAAMVNACDVVASTTRGEGWWLGGAEALACGVPVLAPNHSALPEVVGPGAVLVDPERILTSPYGHDLRLPDVGTMTQQLVQLAREPERLRGLGLAGLEHVREHFSWETATRQWHEFCSSLEAGHAMEHKQPA